MLLAVKIKNAAGLLWDSLDGAERSTLAYVGAWLVLVSVFAVQRRSRERFRRELLTELGADGLRG